jgi:uncharacterized membrane protein (DUF485 family)
MGHKGSKYREAGFELFSVQMQRIFRYAEFVSVKMHVKWSLCINLCPFHILYVLLVCYDQITQKRTHSNTTA